MLEVKLRRVLTIDSEGQAAPCALCGLPMSGEQLEMVQATAIDGGEIIGSICRKCLTYLHYRNPERFPSLAEYGDACRQYATPAFASEEEAARTGETPEVFNEVYDQSWLS